jgi:ABC-type branched-subunit amino acid transport system ATPase component
MSESLIRIEQLTAGYAGAIVLHGLTLSVAPGEVVALLGANGAGKTTLLRSVSGIIRPTSGSVVALGHDTRRVPVHRIARSGLAHVAEGRSVFYGLTVAEHFRLGHRGEILDREHAYQYFPRLRELGDRRAGVLSGGEQQMLALGRALARRPKLLLIDELSLGLAPLVVGQLLPVIRQYVLDTGAGALLVEQHVDLALEIADRAAVMSQGRISTIGPASVLSEDKGLMISSYLGEAG